MLKADSHTAIDRMPTGIPCLDIPIRRRLPPNQVVVCRLSDFSFTPRLYQSALSVLDITLNCNPLFVLFAIFLGSAGALWKTDRGELLDIEMQFAEDGEIIERNLYYHCGMVTRGLVAGEKYGTLKKSISISILNYTLPRMGTEFHTCHVLREERTGETLTNLMQFHYIELPKVNQDKRPVKALTEVEQFLEYLKYAGEPGWEDYVEELKRQGGREIQMTDAIMREVTQEEILRERAIARDKFLHWQASCQRENKKLKSELEEVNSQLKHAIQSLAAQGMDVEKIAEITDMEESQIKAYL